MRIGASLACFGACIASVVGRKSASGPREALESCLDAAGVRSEFKGDARFDADTLAFNRRFRDRPTVIVFPTSGKQVAAAVKCANKADVTIQPRSGGHSYIAQSLSSGMTIDLAGLAAVKLHSDNTVDVGGGARLGKVITTLNAHGRALPTGTCPDVGVGGHAAFGGYGFLGRRYGLMVDRVVEHEVVLANGTLTTASKSKNADLFFALRGAGGSFGLVTRYTFKSVPAPSTMTRSTYTWPSISVADATDVLSAYQSWGLKQVPAELTTEIVLQKGTKKGTVWLQIVGGYIGGASGSNAAFKPLLSAIDAKPNTTSVKALTWIKAAEAFNEAPLSPLPPQKDVFDATSLVTPASAPMSVKAIRSFVSYLANEGFTSSLSNGWFVDVELYGGRNSAVSAVSSSATAYATRDGLWTLQMYASDDGPKLPYPKAGTTLVQGMRSAIVDAMPPSWPWRTYPNYVEESRGLPDWPKRYYGSNYPRLQQLKALYDPTDRFTYDTSIKLPLKPMRSHP